MLKRCADLANAYEVTERVVGLTNVSSVISHSMHPCAEEVFERDMYLTDIILLTINIDPLTRPGRV